jgi:hypothetical protein
MKTMWRSGLGQAVVAVAMAILTTSAAAEGPATSVALVSKRLNLGLFNQNLFGDGISISQIQSMRSSLNPQYDLKDLPGASEFKVLFTIQLLLPEK